MREIRRLDLVWENEGIETYEKFIKMCLSKKVKPADYMKKLISDCIKNTQLRRVINIYKK